MNESSTANQGPTGHSRLWFWFVAAFVLQGAAWTAWIAVAARHKVAEVPLAHRALASP